MMFSICQELREIFAEDETESCFGDDSDDEENEAHFEHRRVRDRQHSEIYDPDTDDYQVTVTMHSSAESIEDEQRCLIKKQIQQLHHRILGGGCPDILDHYHKVKEDLVLQLSELHGSANKAWKDSSHDTLAPSAKMPASMIMGPQARRISRGSAFDSISDAASWLPVEDLDVTSTI
eukprot:Skav221714  [mRNA]  locus=scaffold542:124191:127717:- [translate_table: standard]